jgi:hypothetical protein
MSSQLNDSLLHENLESTPSNENPLFYWLRKLANSPDGEAR